MTTPTINDQHHEVEALDAMVEAPLASVPRPTLRALGPRPLAALWFAVALLVVAIDPAQAEPERPTTLLLVLAEVAFFAWLATVALGAFGHRSAARIGIGAGGLLLAGHLICGIEGHVPMTGAIWVTQLVAVSVATAACALAVATDR